MKNLPEKKLIVYGKTATDWRTIYSASALGFFGAIQIGIMASSLWPYMQIMDPQVTESFYGYMAVGSSVGQSITGPLAGIISNRLNQTRLPLVVGKLTSLCSLVLYLFIETFHSNRRYVFLIYEIVHGLAIGTIGIARAQIAMSSTEADRAKAISIATFAPAVGIALAPVFQVAFSALGYPGPQLAFGMHFNIYTAPVYVAILANICSLIILVFIYREHFPEDDEDESIKSDGDGNLRLKIGKPLKKNSIFHFRFDIVAVMVCLMTNLVLSLNSLYARSLSSPYTMMMFAWTNAQTVIFNSIAQGVVGWVSLIVFSGYIFFRLAERLNDRVGCILALLGHVIFYVITYPWPFLTSKIAMADAHLNATSTMNSNSPFHHPQVTHNDGTSKIECSYDWCEWTPAINVYVYMITHVIVTGLCAPIIMVQLESLFTKILGPIKQGTMQGVFLFSGDIVNTVGPIAMTQVYALSGPTYIWAFQILAHILCVLMWYRVYPRMIPKSERTDVIVPKNLQPPIL